MNLALDNPRLTDSQNDKDAIKNLIHEQNEKLVILAEDIIKHGLSPLDVIAVYPSEKYDNKFVVAEGNRRICVIKILNNPNIISDIDDSMFKKFSKLKLNYKYINEISAFVFNNSIDPALIHWIEIRHMGEQKGKGISKWNSIQKDRFTQKVRGESKLLDFWEQLEKYQVLTYDEIMSITKTNWERILREIGLQFLGIHKVNNQLLVPIDQLQDFTTKMRCIQRKLANKTVGIVYDKDRIDLFFDKVSQELYGESTVPVQENLYNEQPKDMNPKPINHEHVDEYVSPIISLATSMQEKLSNPKGTIRDIFSNCQTVIPKQFDIKSSNIRINRIIKELKNLDVDGYPNSCGALLRLLFELSSKDYIESINGEDEVAKDFETVIKQAANLLKQHKKINNNEHSAIMRDVDNLRLLFNGYMHNTDSYPSSESIKSVFKAHKAFILACLEL